MTLSFDKNKPLRPEIWVDSISGCSSKTNISPANSKMGCVRILGREFDEGPYMELNLLMNSSQIDVLITTLELLKTKI